MIARLTGEVAEKNAAGIVLDVHGVGYGLMVAAEDLGALSSDKPVTLYVYEHIRENVHDLYGFMSSITKQLFELLINVNGVGPKMALNILSIGSVDNVRQAIATGDTKYIQAATGVGKRVAERVIVELKDKVGLASSDSATAFLSAPGMSGDEAVQALMSLGYNVQDANAKLQDIDPSLTVEDRVKSALQRR